MARGSTTPAELGPYLALALAELRTERGWSPSQAAAMLGIHPTTYLTYETRGWVSGPLLGSLEQMAEGFEIEVSELIAHAERLLADGAKLPELAIRQRPNG